MSAAAAPKPAVYYFNGRGRAELTRLLFAEAKIAFDDVRIEGKDWPALKGGAPFGQMPYLKVGNVLIAQSNAMQRYAARQGKLYGATELEAAQIDMIAEGVTEAVTPFATAIFGKDEAEKKAKIEEYFKDAFPKYAAFLTALLKANNGGASWFVGATCTYADIAVYSALGWVRSVNAEPFKAFPELSALIDRVEARPNIAAWVKARPVTAF